MTHSSERGWIDNEYGTRIQGFQNLMRFRIRDVLLVSSQYDSYLFEEDGRLYELIRNEYQGLNLSHSPELTRVSSGADAIALALEEKRFDLIISTLHIEDMHPLEFAKAVRDAGIEIPIVLLAFDNRELAELIARHDTSIYNRIFIWQGDFRLIIAIIKHLEDRLNVDHDTRVAGVQSIILIEDNIRFFSSFLPLIYTEILKQSQRLISEGVNLSHRFLRMRARPKILLCTSFEEARDYFQRYRDHILGVISDIDFCRGGKPDATAGLEFAREVKSSLSDIPILLQSNESENEINAHAVGASFVLKDSPLLLNEVRQFMNTYFSFGDFIFRTSEGIEVGRATDLKSLEEQLHRVPDYSIKYHAERNHFSNWLKARTEFWLAHQLRPRKVTDYPSVSSLRQDLISSLHTYRLQQHRGLISDFSAESFDPSSSFARIGSGSLGGKARGLGFLNMLINTYHLRDNFPGVYMYVPAGVVLGTDVFDQFIDDNNLRLFAIRSDDDREITERFVNATTFPGDVLGQLSTFLNIIREPLAVRSSSLLEDSQYQPFAGVYETYMLPNNNPDPGVRLGELVTAIKRVYASTFYLAAKEYIKVTSYRLEEEKMAVVIQKMVGSARGERFYPDISGVAKSYDFYPSPPQDSSDGVASVALGLGKMVVDGGPAIRFCPKYPDHLPQFYTVQDALANNQHEFFALDLSSRPGTESHTHDTLITAHPLKVAELDGTLTYLGSTYSPENDAVYDGISREGMRLVSFRPLLKENIVPIPAILELLLDMGSWGMGTTVEMEFAVNISRSAGTLHDFGLLQMRPLVVSREFEELSIDTHEEEKILCLSSTVLGNGSIDDLHDIVVVDIRTFDRGKSRHVASEVAYMNAKLAGEGRPFVLIGVGRWGTLDPWLGIPVRWDQISGARVIVETGFNDLTVVPSQGSHFFQNLTAFMIGYFTVNQHDGGGHVEWEWLRRQPVTESMVFTRHHRFSSPLLVKMNGQKKKGVILKPE